MQRKDTQTKQNKIEIMMIRKKKKIQRKCNGERNVCMLDDKYEK